MIKRSLMICQFPGGGSTRWESARYITKLVAKLQHETRISNIFIRDRNDTPITMTRNQALLEAEREGADYVLMIDNDMVPDLDIDGAKPFWDSTFEFMLGHNGPCAVAAPYCGPPPHENCYVFQWVNYRNDDPNPHFAIDMYPRAEAIRMRGIQRAAALPTGLILMDMRGVSKLPHPRFYYEWRDETESEKASTEDVAFTRDLDVIGVPVYCNWDAWAGHIKTKVVGKPHEVLPQSIPRVLRKSAKRHTQEGTTEIPAQRRIREFNGYKAPPANFPTQLVRELPHADPQQTEVGEYGINTPDIETAAAPSENGVHVPG